MSQGRPPDCEDGCEVKKARKSRRGTGEDGAVQQAFPLSPLPPPSFLFFRAPSYFAPLPTGAGTGYPHPLFSGSSASSFPQPAAGNRNCDCNDAECIGKTPLATQSRLSGFPNKYWLILKFSNRRNILPLPITELKLF